MKKRLSAILVLALCVSLCGCGKSRQVQSVEEAISSLGKISLLSFEAIEEAEKCMMHSPMRKKRAWRISLI